MSFRTAYSALSNRRSYNSTRGLNRGLIRDKTPEELAKEREEYDRQAAKRRANGTNSRW